MKANFYIESMPFCEVFDKYKIESFDSGLYVIPDKKSTRKQIPAEKAEDAMIDFLNLGKKFYYCEEVKDVEILSFVEKYGLLGFMEDFSANKYYVMGDEVILRGCNLITGKDALMKVNLVDYLKLFYPRLKEKQISKLINDCNKILSEAEYENSVIQMIDRKLIFSEEYGEPVKMIAEYAKILYSALRANSNEEEYARVNPIISINKLGNEIHRVPTEMGVRFNYLKQGIDFNFLVNITQDISMLKVCKYCGKAFIAANPKAEYDNPNCKNKANVYKSRGKVIANNMIVKEDGTIAMKIAPSEDLSSYFADIFSKK